MEIPNLPFRFPAVPKTFNIKASKEETYGLLEGLEGTWVGEKGWNIMTVPVPGSKDPLFFKVLIRPYFEIITFEKVGGGVPNRGRNEVQTNFAIKYDLQVNDLQTKEGMHAENGMFLHELPLQNQPSEPQSIVRQAIIPHGNSVLAPGTAVEVQDPNFLNNPALDKIFSPSPVFLKEQHILTDYAHLFEREANKAVAQIDPAFRNGFNAMKPIDSLRQDIKGQKIINNIAFDTDTKAEGGGIVNTPFITKNARTPNFRSIFWLEEVELSSGKMFMQLQYAQVTEIVFPTTGDKQVNWPHINVNTLVKIK